MGQRTGVVDTFLEGMNGIYGMGGLGYGNSFYAVVKLLA